MFYVGKGKGGRALAHLRADEKKAIAKKILEIQSSGARPRIEVLAHGLRSPEAAFQIEAAAIELLGLENLTNAVHGKSENLGRMPLDDIVAHYTRKPAKIKQPAILIRINKLYRYGMSDAELYDATRSAWKVGERADRVEYAFSVFEGVIREVYKITGWLPAGSTFSLRRDGARPRTAGTLGVRRCHRRRGNAKALRESVCRRSLLAGCSESDLVREYRFEECARARTARRSAQRQVAQTAIAAERRVSVDAYRVAPIPRRSTKCPRRLPKPPAFWPLPAPGPDPICSLPPPGAPGIDPRSPPCVSVCSPARSAPSLRFPWI